jgi:hypothetical protein
MPKWTVTICALLALAPGARAGTVTGEDAQPSWREIKVVKTAALPPFARIEIRRQRSSGHGDGRYTVAMSWDDRWWASETVNIDDVPSRMCHVGVGRVDATSIKALQLADGSHAVLVDLALEEAQISDCLSEAPTAAEERRHLEHGLAAFYAGGGRPNGHVFIVCGVGANGVRCTRPVSTRAGKAEDDCNVSSTLAIDHDAVVEICTTTTCRASSVVVARGRSSPTNSSMLVTKVRSSAAVWSAPT